MHKYFARRIIATSLGLLFSGLASASGFQLLEQNASGLGNAYAGSAAVAEDASTIFYNPAGMTQLKGTNVSAGFNLIRPSFSFRDSGSTNPLGMGGGAATGGNGGDAAGEWSALPNGYLSYQLSDRWFAGLGFGAPFGLRTEYDDNWVGRYHSLMFDIKTYNINPSVAYKVNDVVSLGFGINWQRIEAEYVKMAVVNPAPPPFLAAKVTNKLDADSWGWNAGITIQPSQDTRIGLSYRSTIKHKAEGTQKFSAIVPNTWAKTTVELPDTFILSAVHNLSDRWQLLGDVSWTGWSSIPKLVIQSGVPATDQLNLKFRDTWRVALGANYALNSSWKLKMGVAVDQSPVHQEENRPASLPDNNRTWLSFGVQYKPSKTSAVDVGYTHLFVNDTKVANNENLATRGLLSGTYESSANIFGMQYSMSF